MKKQNLWTTFAGGVTVISEVALMDALYVAFSWSEHKEFLSPGLPLWAFCALFCYVTNRLFLRRPRSLPVLAVFNGVLWVLSFCALFLFSARLGGRVSVIIAVLFVLISLSRALHLAQNPAKLSSHLTHVDMLALALLWLALAGQNALLAHSGYLTLQLIIFLLNLLCAVALRVGGTDGGKVLVGAPAAGSLLCVGMLGGLILIVSLLIRVFADHSHKVVDHLIHGLSAGLSALWQGFLAVLNWLVSLFPTPQPEDAEIPLPPTDALENGEVVIKEFSLDPRLFWIFGGLAVVTVFVLLLLVIFRLRRSKLSTGMIGDVDTLPAHRRTLQPKLKQRLQALWAAVCFRVTAFHRRNTPAGTLIWLEMRMKKAGAPRLSGETPRAFLLRVSPLLEKLADTLDAQYYGAQEVTLSPSECRRLRRLPLEVRPSPEPCPVSHCDSTEQCQC